MSRSNSVVEREQSTQAARTKAIGIIEPSHDTGKLGATQAMPATTPSARPSRRVWLALAGLAVLGGIGTWRITHQRREASVQPLLVPNRWSEQLFSGRSLRHWTTRSGIWLPVDDDEDAKVLAGTNGVAARRLLRSDEQPPRPLLNFELLLAIRLHQATAVEVHFGILQGADDDTSRFSIRLEGQSAWLAHRAADLGRSQPATEAVSLRSTSVDQPRMVRLRRDAGHWIVSVGDQRIGTMPLAGVPELAEFRLSVEGGPAWFSDIEVAELVTPPVR